MFLDPFGWIFTPRTKDALTIEVDRREIILCKNCMQWDEKGGMMGRGWCGYQMKCTGPYYFCADGKIKHEDGGPNEVD